MVMRPVERAVQHPQIRTIQRISNAYAVTMFETVLRHSPVDPIDTLILLVVTVRNVEHVNNSREMSARHAAWDQHVPDSQRRPISRRAIAGSLSLPVETVRRRVASLIKRGLLAEAARGVILPGDRAEDLPQTEIYFSTNFQLFRRMITQFRAHRIDLTNGLDADPPA